MECVILAGGLGTRMRPATEQIPKALIPVGGRPFVDWQLEWLALGGVRRAVFCIGHKGEQLRDHVGDGSGFGVRVDWVDEGSDLRGTAGALRLALEHGLLPPVFLVVYGDSYLPVSIRAVWDAFAAGRDPALMTVLRNQNQWDSSNARFEDGRVSLYDKFATDRTGMDYIDYGLSVLTRDLVAGQIPTGEVSDLATLFHDLSLGGRLAGFEVTERFYEIGSPEGLAALEALLVGRA